MSTDNYFNFPVPLMQGASNMKTFCNNVMDYCIYKHSLTLTGDEAMTDAADFFGLLLGDAAISEEKGEMLMYSIPTNSATTGIKKTLLFEFYEENKLIHEIAVLMAFLAIKSIIGKKSYTRITNEFLLCRMAGFNAKKDMTELPDYLEKYTRRRGMNNIKLDLQRFYGLKIYGRYTRGYFVSFELTMAQLVKAVEVKRKKYYEKNLKGQQSKAVRQVLRGLYDNMNTQ
jgi:hypothetical protein